MAQCYFCKIKLPEKAGIYRNSECPSCGKDIKICLNCKFYSPGSHYDCGETISELVKQKDRSNFCDYFVAAEKAGSESESNNSDNAKSKFNSLFDD